VRRQQLQKRRRRDLLWYGLGFVAAQLALAVGLEICWPAVRDPEFDALRRVVRDRRAEAPDRELIFILGSSRTSYGLRAERLNHPEQETAPLVLNCSILGSGPMMQQVVLKRLLDAGHCPSLLFLEVMPMSISARDGTPNEERWKWAARFTAPEVAHLWHYYAQPYRLILPWAFGRLLPCERSQADLHIALGIDVSGGEATDYQGRDPYGWGPCTAHFSAEEIKRRTESALVQFGSALAQPAVAPGAIQALRDLANLCHDRHIDLVFIVPPESSAFRSYAPAAGESQMGVVRGLAREFDLSLIDARAWVDDEGFWDGHHMTIKGADQFTERFRGEALEPYLNARPPLSPKALTSNRHPVAQAN
jgi:hypothetical protein